MQFRVKNVSESARKMIKKSVTSNFNWNIIKFSAGESRDFSKLLIENNFLELASTVQPQKNCLA